ncbi:hypothetical protein [Neobacillus niacini]|uniref:hypothetical protein n=1 Tax=Neobacillus niacini TaxID=86668 RepID=UPI002861EA23|nr:hypothetical protein [Neobacillus niacini]MDR7003077.1 signal transduction histidine kinase [Neobacillus niacini]
MSNKLILWLLLIVPWLTLFFMKKEGIKRYMPVTIFTALLVTIVYEIGYTYKLWQIKEAIVPWGYITNVSFAYGAFFITTIWVFYFTFRNFWLYLATNIVIDAFGAWVILKFVEARKLTHFTISSFNLLLIFVTIALIAYVFEIWYEKV